MNENEIKQSMIDAMVAQFKLELEEAKLSLVYNAYSAYLQELENSFKNDSVNDSEEVSDEV